MGAGFVGSALRALIADAKADPADQRQAGDGSGMRVRRALAHAAAIPRLACAGARMAHLPCGPTLSHGASPSITSRSGPDYILQAGGAQASAAFTGRLRLGTAGTDRAMLQRFGPETVSVAGRPPCYCARLFSRRSSRHVGGPRWRRRRVG